MTVDPPRLATTPTVWLFPGASDSGREGFARVVNRSDNSGEVRITAVDDAGMHYGPVTLSMQRRQTVHFNSGDLESGNAGKGLPDGIGSGQGDWRLSFESELDIEVLSYVRTKDGFLTSMYDVAPTDPDGLDGCDVQPCEQRQPGKSPSADQSGRHRFNSDDHRCG